MISHMDFSADRVTRKITEENQEESHTFRPKDEESNTQTNIVEENEKAPQVVDASSSKTKMSIPNLLNPTNDDV